MPTTLSLQLSTFNSRNDRDFGIKAATVQATQERVTQAISTVEGKLAASDYGFVSVLNERSYLDQTQQVFSQLSWAKTMVVVGIGGSDLGARAIQQSLQIDNPPMEVIFHGDSTDPEQIRQLLRKIDLSSTVFNIISKSGQTVETISQYVYFKAKLQAQTSEWQKHFVFTTDPQDGILRQEATTYGVMTLPIPPSVGGRFSVLTPVGLLPALAMGVNIDELVAGAAEFAVDATSRQLAQDLAAAQYRLYTQGTKVAVMMPYSTQLEEFCRWYRQLWAESLGKDGKGILPVQARGPADQHSQLQYYNQGERLHSVLFLRVDQTEVDYTIESTDIEDVRYLVGHSFQEILNAEQESTALSLIKAGRPVGTLTIDRLTPRNVGAVLMLFQLGVVYLAEMIGVNAFDQPGVEESKQFMYGLLGKQGYEDKRTEIEQLRSAK